jgi:hypothetical protein
LNPERVRASEELSTNITGAAQDASAQLPSLFEQSRALFSPERTGLLSQGALAPIFEPWVAKWNAVVDAAGLPEAHVNGLSDTQLANKLAIGQARGLARGAGEKAVAALQQYMSAVPSTGMDKGAAADLVALMATQYAKDIDMGNVWSEGRAIVGNFESQPVMDAFRQEKGYTPDDYNRMQRALSTLYLSKDWPAISAGLSAPRGSKQNTMAIQTINAFGKANGVDALSRALTGHQ